MTVQRDPLQPKFLSCRQVEAANPIAPHIRHKALVLFDSGSNTAFFTIKLAVPLQLRITSTSTNLLVMGAAGIKPSYPSKQVILGVTIVDGLAWTTPTKVLDTTATPVHKVQLTSSISGVTFSIMPRFSCSLKIASKASSIDELLRRRL